MPRDTALDQLSIKISRDDMALYTNIIYDDMADPLYNGLAAHSVDTDAHDLNARFAEVNSSIGLLSAEVDTKIDDFDLSTKADVAGDEFTGAVVFSGSDTPVIIKGAASTDRSMVARTNNANRWELALASNDGEIGGNTGSNLVISRYADNGTFLGIPLSIERSSGEVNIHRLHVDILDANVVAGGVPEGGATGQALIKLDDSNYNVGWGSVASGGGEEVDEVYVGPTPPPNPFYGQVWIQV